MTKAPFDVWVSEDPTAPFAHEMTVEAFGVPFAIGASDADLLERIATAAPPGSRPCDPAAVRARFGLVREDGGYRVAGTDLGDDLRSADPTIAAGLLDVVVRGHVAQHAPGLVFVHAGVVAHRGRAIVVPGLSMSGKSTLVAALVRAGAEYYSDEYAVVDAAGRLHPYPRPLSLRAFGGRTPGEAIGTVGTAPVRAGLVVVTEYAPGAEWRPARLSQAQGVLAILAHTLVARDRPAESLAAATRLARDADLLTGDRGEAADLAPLLLASVETRLGAEEAPG